MLGHITYLSPESMTAKFDPSRLRPRAVPTAFEKKFSVGAYLAYQGDRFVERFDANSYVTLSMVMDLFDLGDTPQALQAALAPSQCRWLVVSFSSDWLFPPEQGRQIADALLALDKPVSYCEVTSAARPRRVPACGQRRYLRRIDSRVLRQPDRTATGLRPSRGGGAAAVIGRLLSRRPRRPANPSG